MFDTMFAQLNIKHNDVKVTLPAYHKWQKEFSFDALRGKKYGESFCNYFGVTDYRIQFERNWISCDRIIRSDWVVPA